MRGKACFQIRQILVAWLSDRYTHLSNRDVLEATDSAGGGGGGGAAAASTTPTPAAVSAQSTPDGAAAAAGGGGGGAATPTATAEEDGWWACSACTCRNNVLTAPTACEVCGLRRDSWACTTCTCRNLVASKTCSACDTPRETPEGSSDCGDSGDGGGGGGGGGSSTSPSADAAAAKAIDSLFGSTGTSKDGNKCTFDLSCGFLVQTARHMQRRITDGSLADYCVICDSVHVFQASGLMPTCCTSGICTALFNDYGIGRAAADGVATSTEVLDLLVSLSRAAAVYDSGSAAQTGGPGFGMQRGGAGGLPAMVPYPRVEDPASRNPP